MLRCYCAIRSGFDAIDIVQRRALGATDALRQIAAIHLYFPGELGQRLALRGQPEAERMRSVFHECTLRGYLLFVNRLLCVDCWHGPAYGLSANGDTNMTKQSLMNQINELNASIRAINAGFHSDPPRGFDHRLVMIEIKTMRINNLMFWLERAA